MVASLISGLSLRASCLGGNQLFLFISPYFWMGMYGCQQGLLFYIPVCNLKK